MKTEDKLKEVQQSDEVMLAVKILIAAFEDCNLNSHIRFTYAAEDNKKYELTFLYLPNEFKYKSKKEQP